MQDSGIKMHANQPQQNLKGVY